jgi:hypothetical protein
MISKEKLRPHAEALSEDITIMCGKVIAKGMLGILEHCVEMQDRIAELERQIAELQKENEALRLVNKIRLGTRADCGRCAELEQQLAASADKTAATVQPVAWSGRTIELKTDAAVFQDVIDNRKPFEIRFNDRKFQIGDDLVLLETRHSGAEMAAGLPLVFTGRQVKKRIGYILKGPIYGLAEGWVIAAFAAPQPQAAQSEDSRELEILRAERDHARTMYENAIGILSGIYALLYPPTVKAEDGKTYAFRSPHLHEQMQALSDRIRAIPDEIAALAQAGKEGAQ